MLSKICRWFRKDKKPENPTEPKINTIEEAVSYLYHNLSHAEFMHIRKSEFPGPEAHFTLGRSIRNNWGLWSHESLLRKDAISKYGIAHADDISGLIIAWMVAKVKGVDFDPFEECKKYHEHWAKLGMTSLAAGGA